MSFSGGLLELVHRSREDFHVFAATIDLLRMTRLMAELPSEARSRLNDLQQGFCWFKRGTSSSKCFRAEAGRMKSTL